MIKKTIRFFTVFIIVLTSILLLLDGLIVKHLIIKKSEELTGKKTTIEKVSLYYFPNIKIEFSGLKIPNPNGDNYIIKSKQLTLNISLSDLLKKKFIINDIVSKNSIFFDSSEQPIEIINTNKAYKEEPSNSFSKDFFSSLNITDSLVRFETFTTDFKPTIELDGDYNKVDNIIATASVKLKENKDKVINLSNQTLYELNQFDINNINSITDVQAFQSKLDSININISSMNIKVDQLDKIYSESLQKISLIEASINNKINNSFSFEEIKNNDIFEKDENNYLKTKIKNYFKKLKISKNNDKDQKRQDKKFDTIGKTYHFSDNESPTFLIKNIEINTLNDSDYLKSTYITLDKNYRQLFKLNFKKENSKNYKKLIINASASNTNQVSVNVSVNEIKFNNIKLIENNNFIFNLESSKSNDLSLTGQISNSSNIVCLFEIKNPNYKIINKTPQSNQLSDLLNYFQNQNIIFEFLINGNSNNFDLTIKNNIVDIANQSKNKFMSNKITNLNMQKKRQINKQKKKNKDLLNEKVNALYNNYNTSLSASKFQLNEVLTKEAQIKEALNKKQSSFKQNVKSKIKDNLKSLGL